MVFLKIIFQFILQILFVIIFFSTVNAKNVDKFDNGKNIRDYLFGFLLLKENDHNQSYNFFKKLRGLENSHKNFSNNFIFSLINSGRFDEAFNYSKGLEKKNLSIFESDLIIGAHYLKNKKYILAKKYFEKISEKNKNKNVIDNFVSKSLSDWAEVDSLEMKEALSKMDSSNINSSSLKKIQNIFLHCFYDSVKTQSLYENLILDEKIDFSRYNYFYASFLGKKNKFKEEKKVINLALKQYPRNLLLKHYKTHLFEKKDKRFKSNFNCQNQTNVVAEILYIAANALSSQSIYKMSNFYLNLSKYLNNDFLFFDTLLAENFIQTDNYNKAKQIYSSLEKKGSVLNWYASKQKSKILIAENDRDKAIKLINDVYEKLTTKDIYVKFDYAEFLKNNDRFEKSIKIYSEVLESIDFNHLLYPEVTDGRGVSYERLGMWKEAEKDLLESLKHSPDQAYVINYLAYSWIEQGKKIEKALSMLQKANKLKSNDPYIIDSLGWALFKLERYKESKYYLQSAVKLMPADPIVNDHYGDVLWMSGKKIQARYYWKYVLKLEETKEDMKKNLEKKLIFGL